MKYGRYIIFYILIMVVGISQIVVILAQTGQGVHASEQLSYLQKRKAELRLEINRYVADQAQLAAVDTLTANTQVLADFQPIGTALALKNSTANTLSLKTELP